MYLNVLSMPPENTVYPSADMHTLVTYSINT